MDAIWQIRKDEDCNDEITDLLGNSSDLFDTTSQKSYPISMEFMYDGVRSRYALLGWFQIMARDKGFVWVLWSKYAGLMQVANLVMRSVVEIPPFPTQNISYGYVIGAMTIGDDYSSFTLYVVIVVSPIRDGYTSCFARFDSYVGKWREFSRLPRTLHPSNMVQLFNETLYTMFRDPYKYMFNHMFALDTMRDAWIDMGWGRHNNANVSKLVTALGRLFFVQLFDDNHKSNDFKGSASEIDLIEDNISIEIEEIDIASRKCLTIATMDKASHGDLLKYFFRSLVNSPICADTAVVGCDEFIVIRSLIGKSIAYDLVNNDLKKWSFGRSIVDLDVKNKVRHGMFAMSMTLTLNPVPPVQQ